MSLNPRSRLAAILRALDAALHPVRTIRTARARRIAYDLYVPRHAREVTYVLPIPLTERPYEAPMPVHDVPAAANYQTDAWPEVLVELFDGPVVGGYVGVGGERVAA